ncbi:MAG TPA: LysR substrate-binding domain-containing protein [Beijerinckiaceae bacterium]|nr:LysR substrate-binding domain-containing protein [Beijerinckiaceae bacterium]
MDLRELTHFVKIVELGSLSRAAEVLHIAQPALGLQVRNLEAELQQQLLLRHSRGVEPTEAGRVLLEHAKIIMNDVAVAKRAVAELREPMGRVSLGMTASANTLLLGDLYRNMIATYPKLTLNVIEALSGTLTQKMLEGEIELACIYSQFELKGLVLEPMISDEWVFVSSETNPPPGTEIRFEDLTKYPLILPSRVSGMRMRLEGTAAERGLTLNIILEVQSESLMKNLIERGIGYTILPYDSVRNDRQVNLHCTRIIEPHFPSRMFLAYPEKPPLSRGAAAVRGLLLDLVQSKETAAKNAGRA